MKRLGMYVAATAVAAMGLLTSCLNGDNTTSGAAFGVITVNKAYQPVVNVGGAYLYSAVLEGKAEGECCLFSYNINYDEQPAQVDYTLATISNYTKINQYQVRTVYDALKPRSMEQPILGARGIQLVGDKLFVESLAEEVEKQSNTFELYYSLDSVSVDGSDNVYNLYLLATKDKTEAGTIKTTAYSAYDVKNMIREISYKETGKNSFKFRIKFIKSINKDDKTKFEWGQSPEIQVMPIPKEDK